MSSGTEPPESTRGDTASPLRIIALFIALSEALAMAGAVATDGTARLLLTVFAVVFPFVVLAVFVWILVQHTEKLYAPHQYTESTTIEAFAAATRRRDRDTQLVIRSAVSEAVATTVATDGPRLGSPDDVRERFVESFDRVVAQASVTLVRHRIIPDAGNTRLPVTDETTIQDLLDSAYFALAPAIDPFTYGDEWVLVDGNGVVLTEMGTAWAQQRELGADFRLLADVGVSAGETLTAVRRASLAT